MTKFPYLIILMKRSYQFSDATFSDKTHGIIKIIFHKFIYFIINFNYNEGENSIGTILSF